MSYINKIEYSLNKSKSFIRDILKMISGTGFSQIIAFLFLPFISRIFLPEDFAVQALFIQVTGLLVALMSFKFEQFILFPKDNSDSVSILFLLVIICLVNSILYLAFIFFLNNSILQIYKLGPLYLWYLLPLCSIFMVLASGFQIFLQRFERYGEAAMSDVVNKLGYILAIFFIFYIIKAPYPLILSLIFGFFLKFLFLLKYAAYLINKYSNGLKYLVYNAKNNFKRYFAQAFYFTISDILVAINGIVLSLFISSFYGLDFFGSWAFVQATLYAPAAFAGNAAGQVYMQRASSLYNKGNSFDSIFLTTIRLLFFVSFPAFLAIVIFGNSIYLFVFGSNWELAGEMASIIAISYFFSFISNPLARSSLIAGKKFFLLLLNIFRLLISLIIISFSKYFELDIWNFIWISTILMSLFYIFEIFMNYSFTKLNFNKDLSKNA